MAKRGALATPMVSKALVGIGTCCAVTLLMGTLHAWSVLTGDLEVRLGLGRTHVTLPYSIALVSLTATVLFAVPLYTRWSPAVMFAIAFTGAAAGLLIASSGHLFAIIAGYGVIFGVANGLAYGYTLQLSARVAPNNTGLAMGITTASYALGSVIGARLLADIVASAGALIALRTLGLVLLFAAPVIALLAGFSGARYGAPDKEADNEPLSRPQLLDYWISYGLAVAAGLMAIAHAAPFIASITESASTITFLGVVILGLGNVAGGVGAGYLSDRINVYRILVALPLIAAAGLALGALAQSLTVALIALGLVGLTYGALIAVYPVAIARQFGSHASARAYGRIFTAWGTAGLLAPLMAGLLFDMTSSYQVPLLAAMAMSLASAIVATRLGTNPS